MASRLPLRILLAEDNAINKRVASHVLLHFGYEVDIVSTGLEAVEAVNRIRYDLVFMDLQMPGMDGLQATRRIRTNPPLHGRPFIAAMTANALKEDRDLCVAAGMDDYLSKPIQPTQVKEVLERCFDRTIGTGTT